MKILIKFPTRNRPAQFFKVLDMYYSMLSDIDNTEFCISIDEDDIVMNNDTILDKLDSYRNLIWYVGNNTSKIEAINSDMEDFQDFDIILLASDDMIPQVMGYDDIIRQNMEKYYPDTDGILWFYDGKRKNLNTLCILGKKYYDRFGYIYHPSYKSFYCDDEFTQVGNILKKQTFIDNVIIEHRHPDNTLGLDTDELYIKNSKYYPIDHKMFQIRKKNKFGLKKIS